MPHSWAFTEEHIPVFVCSQAVGYSLIPNNKDEDGLVVLVFNRKETEIRSQQQQLVESLHKVLGGNQTLTVNVEGVKTLPDDQYVNFLPSAAQSEGLALHLLHLPAPWF